mmetsp:Transcript_9082/g.27190  ORF Transcript_9082/g.27190 Transcript_9082/m.27190 type:complete len:452 (-) Transcript_9082:1903-3258(-)
MGRHAVPLPDGRVVGLRVRSCPGAKPVAVADWGHGGAAIDARTMAAALMAYFSGSFRPEAVTVSGAPPPPSVLLPTGVPAGGCDDLAARIYPLVALVQPRLAARVTGMLLEKGREVVGNVLASPTALDANIAEAVAALQARGVGAEAEAVAIPTSAPAASKRAKIRALLARSTLRCVLSFGDRRIRDAVGALAYLGGPRSPGGTGDQWRVEWPRATEGRARRCAGLFLGGITHLSDERLLAFFRDELCGLVAVQAVDTHTAVAQCDTRVMERGRMRGRYACTGSGSRRAAVASGTSPNTSSSPPMAALLRSKCWTRRSLQTNTGTTFTCAGPRRRLQARSPRDSPRLRRIFGRIQSQGGFRPAGGPRGSSGRQSPSTASCSLGTQSHVTRFWVLVPCASTGLSSSCGPGRWPWIGASGCGLKRSNRDCWHQALNSLFLRRPRSLSRPNLGL